MAITLHFVKHTNLTELKSIIYRPFLCRLSKRHGRRKLLHISGLGMAVSALLVAICLHSGVNKIMLLTCVLSYVAFGSLGVITIPWSLAFELLPTKVKLPISPNFFFIFFCNKIETIDFLLGERKAWRITGVSSLHSYVWSG